MTPADLGTTSDISVQTCAAPSNSQASGKAPDLEGGTDCPGRLSKNALFSLLY